MMTEPDDLDDLKMVLLGAIIGALGLTLVAVIFWSF